MISRYFTVMQFSIQTKVLLFKKENFSSKNANKHNLGNNNFHNHTRYQVKDLKQLCWIRYMKSYEYLINPKHYNTLLNKHEYSCASDEEIDFYKARIINLTAELLNNNRNIPIKVKDSFENYLAIL